MTDKYIEEIVEEMAQQEWLLIGDVPIAQRWLRIALTSLQEKTREEIRKNADKIIDDAKCPDDFNCGLCKRGLQKKCNTAYTAALEKAFDLLNPPHYDT